MPCDPLGPFLIADWVPRLGLRFWGRTGSCSRLSVAERSVSSEDQERRKSRLENGEAAVRRRQALAAGVSSSTTRSR
jgi:hypothetical protein